MLKDNLAAIVGGALVSVGAFEQLYEQYRADFSAAAVYETYVPDRSPIVSATPLPDHPKLWSNHHVESVAEPFNATETLAAAEDKHEAELSEYQDMMSRAAEEMARAAQVIEEAKKEKEKLKLEAEVLRQKYMGSYGLLPDKIKGSTASSAEGSRSNEKVVRAPAATLPPVKSSELPVVIQSRPPVVYSIPQMRREIPQYYLNSGVPVQHPTWGGPAFGQGSCPGGRCY